MVTKRLVRTSQQNPTGCEFMVCGRGIKNALLWSKMQRMTTRQTRTAIVTIEVITWVAIIPAMGLILTVIASSIYGSLGMAH